MATTFDDDLKSFQVDLCFALHLSSYVYVYI